MVLGKLDRYMQKNETRPLFTPHTRINSKWIRYLNVRPETIKILEKNIGSKISDIARRNFLSDISHQARETIGTLKCLTHIDTSNLAVLQLNEASTYCFFCFMWKATETQND